MKKSIKYSTYSSRVVFVVLLLVFFIFASQLSAKAFQVTNTSDSGPGSLRQAIIDANATPGKDAIIFNIPGVGPHTIQPVSGLPWIGDPVIIDGATQPGADCRSWPPTLMIELDGSLAGGASGIVVSAGTSHVRGLVINRFSNAGIELKTDNRNRVESNFIGTDVTGAVVLGNGHGIIVSGGSEDNRIGGVPAKKGNLISGNNEYGIWLLSSNNAVVGNCIGTNAAGNAGLGNGASGIGIVEDCVNNVIGGSSPNAGNLISGNNFEGMEIGGAHTVVQGNFIGTDITGTVAIPNGGCGIFVHGSATHTTIGGNAKWRRNVISGNGFRGVWLNSSNNTVAGNLIGTDVTGAVALGNAGDGVVIEEGAELNTIGGKAKGTGNIISANGYLGIWLLGSNNLIAGNYIGTDVNGMAALGNGSGGLSLHQNASNNVIGGSSAKCANVISGNQGDGVSIYHSGTTGNLVQGNLIGTNKLGEPVLGNTQNGVNISQQSGHNTVGGSGPFGGNVIAGNAWNGILIGGDAGLCNRLQHNSIFANAGLGIDLGGDGVTENDPDDADTGPNNLQNYPVLGSATLADVQLDVTGTIDTPNPETITVEFFANPVPTPGGDPSGYGEGCTYIGSTTPDVSGNFTAHLPLQPASTLICATATDAAGNTSEFAANIEVQSGLEKSSSELVEIQENVPTEFSLSQNYPNPFNPTTTIEFALPCSEHVTLTILNLMGQEIVTLLSGEFPQGYHKYQWTASGLSSGVYLYRLQTASFEQTKKLVFVE